MMSTVANLVKAILPRPTYNALKRNIRFLLPQLLGSGRSQFGDPMPPPTSIFVGGDHTNFKTIGEEFLNYFVSLGGLRPSHTVLDVGCGIGRMALPLSKYLDANGRYFGFDIVADGIDWCRKNISTRHPNFEFERVDIYNKEYNPSGKILAKDFRFPRPERSFDFVFATSLFTHMFLPDIENYILEIGRTLKPGGRFLLTFFLLNDESMRMLSEGKAHFSFQHRIGDVLTGDKDVPEAAIAVPEDRIRHFFAKAGLRVIEPIRYGAWSGREEFLSGQDVVVGEKA